MSSVTEQVFRNLDPSHVSAIAAQLGIDPAQAQAAIQQAVPLVVGGLARNASTESGATALHGAAMASSGLDVGSILGSVLGGGNTGAAGGGLGSILGGLLGGGAGGGSTGGVDAGAILGGLFGGREDQAAQNLGQSSGIGTRNAGLLLTVLAPIVMSVIGRMSQGNGLDAGGLGGALAQDDQHNRQGAGGGLLGSVLDQDGDGQFGLGDLLKLGTQVLGGTRRA